MDNRIVAWLGLVIMTILSGVGDSQGFLYASRMWQNGRLNGDATWRSALGFAAGIIFYWGAIRFFDLLGINSPEVQTVAWFVVTLAGVAMISGEFFHWSRIDQVVGVVAILAVGLLMLRNGG